MKRALILANGKQPPPQLLRRCLREADFFICADGGANIALRNKVKPHLIIGDFDSIHKISLEKFKQAEILWRRDQNSTDLEKALAYAIEKHFDELVVLGATGGRIDHEVGNLSALVKYSRKAHISFIDEFGKLISVIRETNLQLPVGTTISLIPLTSCEGVVTKGLKWNLKNETLRLGFRESTSNVTILKPVSIRIRSGELVIFIANTKSRSLKKRKINS